MTTVRAPCSSCGLHTRLQEAATTNLTDIDMLRQTWEHAAACMPLLPWAHVGLRHLPPPAASLLRSRSLPSMLGICCLSLPGATAQASPRQACVPWLPLSAWTASAPSASRHPAASARRRATASPWESVSWQFAGVLWVHMPASARTARRPFVSHTTSGPLFPAWLHARGFVDATARRCLFQICTLGSCRWRAPRRHMQ